MQIVSITDIQETKHAVSCVITYSFGLLKKKTISRKALMKKYNVNEFEAPIWVDNLDYCFGIMNAGDLKALILHEKELTEKNIS